MAFIELVPRWIQYDQFWRTLRKRNIWLIHLRYGAVAMLVALCGAGLLTERVNVALPQVALLTVCILLYNVVFHRTAERVPEGYAGFHGLHYALLQMAADMAALVALVHLTGGASSPFLLFFIFHVIIGSLLLPRKVVSVMITIAVLTSYLLHQLELQGMLPPFGFGFDGLRPLLDAPSAALRYLMLAVTLFFSNYLANSISEELYKRERALTLTLRKLEEAELAKSRYVMSVVHDLKTPIAAAGTYLDTLLDGSAGEPPAAFAKPLERSRARLENAIHIINDILQYTQLKLQAPPEVEPVNLTEMVDEIYQEMRVMFVAKRIRFSTWTNAADDVVVEAERRTLRMALANLISNAHKYTEANGRVEVHVKQREGLAVIEVADDGIGIPEAEQERIFQDFFRAAGAKKRGIEGTGLGLSVVRHIVDQFNGEVRVESPSRLESEGRPGSAFKILLPISYVPRSPDVDFDDTDIA